ncbi:hypothetical protein DV736_g2881, partial [Chaetothyriales sp. CBS 134916]
MSSSRPPPAVNLYPYDPSMALAITFACLVGSSLAVHTIQNFYFRYWPVTFFLFYGGIVFCTGWITRAVSTHDPSNLNLYIASTVLVYAGPPIYAAAEYNVLGRLMFYLPMHAPMNPARLKYFFIYLGALVEALTGAGAGKLAASRVGTDQYKSGSTLIAVSLVLQGVVEIVFVFMVALMHTRARKAGVLTPNVRCVCITLYGCSTLVLIRCVFRAVEAFLQYKGSCKGGYSCGGIITTEWYLYVFEAAPMVVYTAWFNVMHPGRFLPRLEKRYLDLDARTERTGPGWIDQRPIWLTFVDPFNNLQDSRSSGDQTMFWNSTEQLARGDDDDNDASETLARISNSETTMLALSLAEKFDESFDLRFHLSWTYGNFLEDIPRRIGANPALDASILQARGYFHTDNEFEQKILLSLRGPVLLEALWNDKIQFTQDEWLNLVESKADASTLVDRMMKCCAQMPDLLRRGRLALQQQRAELLTSLIQQARQQYEMLLFITNAYKQKYNTFKANPALLTPPGLTVERMAHTYHRIYGLSLGLCLISSSIAQGLDVAKGLDLQAEALLLCGQVMLLAEEGTIYRPLGSDHMLICLLAGWSATIDCAVRARLLQLYRVYTSDLPESRGPQSMVRCLEWSSQRLRFQTFASESDPLAKLEHGLI